MKKKMKKIVMAKAVLAVMCFFCFGLRADASDSRNIGTVVIDMDDMEVTRVGEGHTVTVMDGGNIMIESIVTKDEKRIVTQIGDDISEYYEDFSTGIAVLTLNKRVVEVYDMEELRKGGSQGEYSDSGRIVRGIGLAAGAVCIAGAVFIRWRHHSDGNVRRDVRN